MKSNFVTILSSIKHVYRRYQKLFSFKNALYYYLRVEYYNKKDINVLIIELSILISESHSSLTHSICETLKSFVIKETNDSSNIIYLISIDRLITRYIFRGFHYIIIIMQFFLLKILYDLYFNIRYIISLIDRVFL